MSPCFPEPAAADTTEMRWGESGSAYLARSTVPRAVETRRFLNECVAALPPADASALCAALWRDPWGSPLTELVVGMALLGLGADPVRYEAPTPTGKALDWLAHWPDGAVYVEVATPRINASAEQEMGRNEALVAIIRDSVPPGWRVWVSEVPNLGPDDRKKPLREALHRVYAGLPADPAPDARVHVYEELEAGVLELDLLPARPEGGPAIEVYPAVGYMDDAFLKIEDMVRDKRAQARGAEHPVLVAIRGALGTHMEQYDIALFGRTVAHVAPGIGQYATSFDPSGILAAKGAAQPTIAGVLAFPEIGVAGAYEPVLYLHRRFTGDLPAGLRRLEQRRLSESGIAITRATGEAFAGVGWARRD